MKLFKKISAAVMATALVFSAVPAYAESVPEVEASNTTAYALLTNEAMPTSDSTGISIQLNGKNLELDGAAPMIKDSRVFVPFRTVFEALGAEVSYDDAEKAITASTDDTTVKFVIGQTDITIEKDGQTTTETSDAASFVEGGYTYVPVRLAAQALGCEVGWDSDFQTVVIVDKDAILGNVEGNFTFMEKYAAYSAEIADKNPALDGSLDFSLTIPTTEDPAKITGTFDMFGKTSEKEAILNTDIKLDLKDVVSLIEAEGETVDADLQSIFDLLKEFNFDIVMNIEDGMFYATSPLLDKALNLEENTWIAFDLNEIFAQSGVNMDFATLVSTSEDVNYEEKITSMLDLADINNAYLTAANIQSTEMIIKLFADSSLTKTDEGYTSEYTLSQYGSTFKMTSTFKTDENDNVTGYKMDMEMLSGEDASMTVSVDNTGVDTKVSMTMSFAEDMAFTLNGSFKYQKNMNKTLNTVKTTSNVISMEDMIAKLTAVPEASADTAAEVTEAPATEAPATEAPATEAPATETEVTEVVTSTETPATEETPAA